MDKELIDFLLLDIPEIPPRPEGFLDIVGCQYHENTITRVYSYFLDKSRNDGIANLFLESLVELIALKSPNLTFSLTEHHECVTEYTTNQGNRIDLVILSKSSTETADHVNAFIIENKIFSSLNNDLEDYYNSVNAQNKIGILLTLQNMNCEHSQFVNITHLEWINRIKAKGLPVRLTTNEFVYLNDFIRNMENLSESNSLPSDAKFCFEYTNKVLRARQTYDSAHEYVINQLKILADKLEWRFYGNSANWRHIWDEKNKSEVYFAFALDNVISEKPRITVFLEVYKDALKKQADLRKILKENGVYELLDDDNLVNNSWAHLGFKTYHLEISDIENLSVFLFQKIKSDFTVALDLVTSEVSKTQDLV